MPDEGFPIGADRASCHFAVAQLGARMHYAVPADPSLGKCVGRFVHRYIYIRSTYVALTGSAWYLATGRIPAVVGSTSHARFPGVDSLIPGVWSFVLRSTATLREV